MLNLTGSHPAVSVPALPTSQPLPVKPQQVTTIHAPQPTPQPNITPQPPPTMSFQPRLPSQANNRPAFGQQTQPLFGGGQAFNLPKQKDAIDMSKQPQPFVSLPSSKPFAPSPSVLSSTASGFPTGFPTTTENLRTAAGSQSLAVGAASTSAYSFSSVSSQSFNFGLPVGQSTPAPAANKLPSQIRFDTPVPNGSSAMGAKTVSSSSVSAAVSAAGNTVAGDLTLQLNAA